MDWDFFDEPSLDDETRKVIGEVPKGPWVFEDGKILRPKEYKGEDREFRPASNAQITQNGTSTTEVKPIANGSAKDGDAVVEPKEQNGDAH